LQIHSHEKQNSEQPIVVQVEDTAKLFYESRSFVRYGKNVFPVVLASITPAD
jgi:hypothetical protein